MTTIAVVSPYAEQLDAILRPRLPAQALMFSAPCANDLPAPAQEADIAFGSPDVLVPLLSDLPKLRWVQSTWAGVTPLLAHSRRDYVLTGVKELFGAAMSEYVLGWVLALERSILLHAQGRRWEFRRDRGLSALRLGIAGTGSIGREVAKRCAPFFAEIVGLNSDGRALPEFSRCYATGDRRLFSEDLDVLAMVLPETASTNQLIAARELSVLARGAILINGGRANALDVDAAVGALERGHLAALVLDVFAEEPLPEDDPLWNTDGVYITSHSAAPTDVRAVAEVFLANLQRYLSGDALVGLIDFERGY